MRVKYSIVISSDLSLAEEFQQCMLWKGFCRHCIRHVLNYNQIGFP